jgi:xanthine dehydrogenase molybdopterin-binding subunit B
MDTCFILEREMTHITESDKAVSLYSQVPKEHNCAQAVAKAFGRDDLIVRLKSCGGGRAEGGLCGALYAALLMLPENKKEEAEKQFCDRAGDILCKAIRREGKTPCVECVRIAADLASKDKNRCVSRDFSTLPKHVNF